MALLQNYKNTSKNTWQANPKTILYANNLVKGDTKEDHTLYASHSIWNSKEDFINWTKSEAFRLAHKNAGQHQNLYLGHPNFEGFEKII